MSLDKCNVSVATASAAAGSDPSLELTTPGDSSDSRIHWVQTSFMPSF